MAALITLLPPRASRGSQHIRGLSGGRSLELAGTLKMLRRNAACVQAFCSIRSREWRHGWPDPIYSEVIYETQSSFVVLERSCDRSLLEAAVHVAQRTFGLLDHRAGCTGFEQLHAEHAAACRPVEPVDEPAAGLVQQRNRDATTG